MKIFEGVVTSTKMKKTATVLVERVKVYPLYKKRVKIGKKYHAHDEWGVKVGDRVRIQECRPISRKKKFKIIEVIKK